MATQPSPTNPFQLRPLVTPRDALIGSFPRAAARHAVQKLLQQMPWDDQDGTGDYDPSLEEDDGKARRRAKRKTRAKSNRVKKTRQDLNRPSETAHALNTETSPASSSEPDLDESSSDDADADADADVEIEEIDRSHDDDPEYWGRWGRPIRFSFSPTSAADRIRTCYFHLHPMFGHPAPDPTSRSGGIRRSSNSPDDRADFMCFACTMSRVSIGFCPHGAFCRVNEGLNLNKAYRRLSKGRVRRSTPLCTVCSGFAAYSCRDGFHQELGSRLVLGCGLALCRNCFRTLGKKYKSNLEEMLQREDFEGEQYPTDVRADVDFLRMNGGPLAKLAVEKGVFSE